MVVGFEERVTLRLRRELPYQSKSMRGVGRVEASKGKVDLVRIADRMPYRPEVKLCIERARLVTESYKRTEGEPMVLRRAKAMAHLLDNMTLYILPHERIVGNIASRPSSIITYPELWWRWLDKAIDEDYKVLLSDEERAELHEIHKYWQGKAVHGMERDLLPEDVKPYWYYNNHGVFRWVHGGHVGTVDFEKVFRIGLNGIIKEAEERLREIESTPEKYLDAPQYLKQKRFLEAVIISLNAAIRLGQRFAVKARAMAEEEQDRERRRELEEMAQICEQVPGNPPRTFHEALQCYWFVTLIARILDLQSSGFGDRLDQILYPFYKKDVEEGRLTREQAQELVEHLFLKMNEEGALVPPGGGGGGGPLVTRVITIGGQTRDGTDATNDLTYIIMDAQNSIRLVQPASIAIRLHRNSPQELIYKVIDSLRVNAASYALFNDEMMIPYLMALGIPLEDAREYSTDGCMRWTIPGKAIAMRALGGAFALAKCLELALYQGWDKFLDKQVGAATPDPATFTCIEDVIDAYLAQVRFFLEKLVTIYNIVDVLDEEWLPQPFLSALLDGCIENGKDCREYKYFPNTIIQTVSQVTLVNSLAAIKKVIFDDKKATMRDLVEALKKNWEGYEELRQMCLDAPKFGNDDDYVDLIARDVYLRTAQTFRSFKNIWGGPFVEDGTAGSGYFNHSGFTGATPDGRKDRDLFNDGTISPVIGTDKKGPTAVLKSVAKVDHVRTMTHLLNQRFAPQFLEGDSRDAFAAYLRTWVDLGIHHIQFNVFDRETLLDAQRNPDKYSDLIVRVAGYAAYFVDLQKGIQDQIIARTEQGF